MPLPPSLPPNRFPSFTQGPVEWLTVGETSHLWLTFLEVGEAPGTGKVDSEKSCACWGLCGGGMTNYTMSPSPNRQSPPWNSCVLCLGPLPVPRRWGRQCSRSPLQHPFTGTWKGAKAHGIYGRVETQLFFPTSPWQHTQSHLHPVLKGWEWSRMPKNKTTMGLKVPYSWQFFVTMGNTMTRKVWQEKQTSLLNKVPTAIRT